MTSSFTPSPQFSNLSLAECRQLLTDDLQACRQSTLQLANTLSELEFRQQAHAEFSPIGWHLGHIAFTESLWILEHLNRDSCPYPQYQQLFAADGLPKAERENLPGLAETLAFMADVRDRTLAYLATAPLADQLRLWRWLLQHESQHVETATYVLTLHRWRSPQAQLSTPYAFSTLPAWEPVSTANMAFIPAGEVTMGLATVDALDNERSPFTVSTADYWIDRTPVTVADYRRFIAGGGYQDSQWWHPRGWHWMQKQGITQPLYWDAHPEYDDTPVCGVSWYEADAYACFVGKRLPTEVEWERAARWHPTTATMQTMPWGDSPATPAHGNFGGAAGGVTPVGQFPAGRSATGCDDLLGNVWEWTDSWFAAYPEFSAYPYAGYSQVYFDQSHRVLRGGSWATRPWVLRPTFRNWYQPQVRQVFAGFRCALSA